MKNIITVSKLEFFLLCNSLTQVKQTLDLLGINMDEEKFVKDYLAKYRKYRALLEEHSGPEGAAISLSDSEEKKG